MITCNQQSPDVMTDKEVEDWDRQHPSSISDPAFPYGEVCTRCGYEWNYHGCGNGGRGTSCVKKDSATGWWVALPTTFMPTNLPPGFVRKTPAASSPYTITTNIVLDPSASDLMGHPKGNKPVAQSVNNDNTVDLSDWRTWRDVNRHSDECACGMKRELCDYHR